MERHSNFDSHMKMADIIHSNYFLLPVVNRFGIHLGFGEKTVAELCLNMGINTEFFLEVLNTFNDPQYFPEKKLRTFKIDEMVEYLRKTHHYYTSYVMANIEMNINKLVESGNVESDKMKLIRDFYLSYKNEFIAHISGEEEIVFPYAIALQKKVDNREISSSDEVLIATYSISDFTEEHGKMDDKLMDLKNIFIKYLPYPADDNLCNNIILKLFSLDGDVKDHSRIEDKILVPKIQELENSIAI